MSGAAFAGSHATYHMCAVIDRLGTMEGTRLSCKALTNDARMFIDPDGGATGGTHGRSLELEGGMVE